MLPRRHPRPALGSGVDVAARQRPVFLPSHLRAEWDAVCQGYHNFLLVGTPSATNGMLAAMAPHFGEPLQRFSPKAGLPVPQPSEGTLILLEVARLDAKQQTQLLRWLDQFDQRSRVQVVSTTSKPLFSLVEKGAFLVDLYYKLNIVRIDLIGLGSAGRHARLRLD
jgi:sigma-54-interacting transcriptional regulator